MCFTRLYELSFFCDKTWCYYLSTWFRSADLAWLDIRISDIGILYVLGMHTLVDGLAAGFNASKQNESAVFLFLSPIVSFNVQEIKVLVFVVIPWSVIDTTFGTWWTIGIPPYESAIVIIHIWYQPANGHMYTSGLLKLSVLLALITD